MVSTYSHQRRLNAVKALVLLAVIVALILAPRLVRAELVEHVQRFEGDSRVETAVAISRSLINERHSRRHIVLATADDFADAQSATPLAVRADTAILLTPRGFLHPMVKDELARTLEPGGQVLIAGGEQALSPKVAEAITEMGYTVQRLHGATRVETAITLSEHAATVVSKAPGILGGELARPVSCARLSQRFFASSAAFARSSASMAFCFSSSGGKGP